MGRWTGKPRSKKVTIGCGNCGQRAKIYIQGEGEVRLLGLTHQLIQHSSVTRQRAQTWDARVDDDDESDDAADGDD